MLFHDDLFVNQSIYEGLSCRRVSCHSSSCEIDINCLVEKNDLLLTGSVCVMSGIHLLCQLSAPTERFQFPCQTKTYATCEPEHCTQPL